MIVINRWLENTRKNWVDIKDTQYYSTTLEQMCKENYELESSGLEWLFNLYDITTKWVNSAHVIQEWNREGHYTLKYDNNTQCGYLECRNQGTDHEYYDDLYEQTAPDSITTNCVYDTYYCTITIGEDFKEQLENASSIDIQNLYVDILCPDKVSGEYTNISYNVNDIDVNDIHGIISIKKKIQDENYEHYDFPPGPYPMYDNAGVVEYYYDSLSIGDRPRTFRSGDRFYSIVDTGLIANIDPYKGSKCYNIETRCTQNERFSYSYCTGATISIKLVGSIHTPYESNLTISKKNKTDTFTHVGFSPKKQTTPNTIFDFNQTYNKIGENEDFNIFLRSFVKKDEWTNYSLDPRTFIYYNDIKIKDETWNDLFNTLQVEYDNLPILSSDKTHLDISNTFLEYKGNDKNVIVIRFKTPSGDEVVDFYVNENMFINTRTNEITDNIPLGQACYVMDGLKCFLWKSPESISKTLKEIIESNYCMMDSIYLINKDTQPTIPETYIDSSGYTRHWSDLKNSTVISVPEYKIQDELKITVLSFSDNKQQEGLTEEEKDGQYFNKDFNNTKYWGTTPVYRRQ